MSTILFSAADTPKGNINSAVQSIIKTVQILCYLRKVFILNNSLVKTIYEGPNHVRLDT